MSSSIKVDNSHFLFSELKNNIEVGRYHSWGVKTLPSSLKEIGYNIDDKLNMAFQHKTFPSTGIQFHPESIMTKNGLKMIENWIFN